MGEEERGIFCFIGSVFQISTLAATKGYSEEPNLFSVVPVEVLVVERKIDRFHHSMRLVCDHTCCSRYLKMFGLVDRRSRLRRRGTAVLVEKEDWSCLETD